MFIGKNKITWHLWQMSETQLAHHVNYPLTCTARIWSSWYYNSAWGNALKKNQHATQFTSKSENKRCQIKCFKQLLHRVKLYYNPSRHLFSKRYVQPGIGCSQYLHKNISSAIYLQERELKGKVFLKSLMSTICPVFRACSAANT